MKIRPAAFFLVLAVLTVVLWAFLAIAIAPSRARAGTLDDYASWPLLRSTFPSTGGNGFTIKGYDPVISGGKCITTFMAVPAGDNPKVYANVVEYDAVAVAGGTLCRDGKWRAFDGGASGTTPFRFFFKDGMFRARP
jgi:hypothetical protein